QNQLAVAGNHGIVGPAGKRHLLDNLSALAIHHVQKVFRAGSDVEPVSVRRKSHHFGRLNTSNGLHDLVGGRVNHVDGSASPVGDIDAAGGSHNGQRREQ